LDNLLSAMTFFQAAPYFFVAIASVAVFATRLGWFPASQGYDTATLNPGFSWAFIANVLDHAVLPALTIVLASVAGWILGMRNIPTSTRCPTPPTWSTRCCTSPRPPEPRRESPHRCDGRSLRPRTG
jgi:hypothetical protein